MSHIDFVIGFVVVVSAMILFIYLISNTISNNVNEFRINEARESSLSLENYLFKINDEKSLISTFRELQVILTEVNNTDHTEEIRISIDPQVDKVKVYDTLMNEIQSTNFQSPPVTILYFDLSFTANEKKFVKIIYFGNIITDIDYLSIDNNITLHIVSDKEIDIVSQEKCSNLLSASYEETKNKFGFQNSFRLDLDGCSYGPEPPLIADIILKNVPVIFEGSDGLLTSKIARLRVW